MRIMKNHVLLLWVVVWWDQARIMEKHVLLLWVVVWQDLLRVKFGRIG